MATHSSLLAWRITRTEEPGRLHIAHSDAKSDMTDHTGLFAILFCEGYADDGLLSKKKKKKKKKKKTPNRMFRRKKKV